MNAMCLAVLAGATLLSDAPENHRRPRNEAEIRDWLQNMVWHHRFTTEEVSAATGLSVKEVSSSLKRFAISADTKPPREKNDRLLVLPYPGGRHPRIGFLEGAV